MENIIDCLSSFNSKERFFLVGQILGNPHFNLSKDFCKDINDKLRINISDNSNETFAAMDYHLDWLYASLKIATENGNNTIYSNKDKIIKAQQEDIDFIIAYKDGEICHIILIEAKGVTGWTNDQIKSKTNRLKIIFGEDLKKWKNVIPHFVLMSPKEPEKLNISNWPEWMKTNKQINWIKLKIQEDLKMVSRCNEMGDEDQKGEYWKVTDRRKSLKFTL